MCIGGGRLGFIFARETAASFFPSVSISSLEDEGDGGRGLYAAIRLSSTAGLVSGLAVDA